MRQLMFACAVLLSGSTVAHALPVEALSIELVDLGTAVRFDIRFDRMPDLTTTDSVGRPADAFSFDLYYFYRAPLTDPGPDVFLRDVSPFGDAFDVFAINPTTGSWLPLPVAPIPYTVTLAPITGYPNSALLTVTINLATIGSPADGFEFDFDTYTYGRLGNQYHGEFRNHVPEPATLGLLMLGLPLLYRLRRGRAS